MISRRTFIFDCSTALAGLASALTIFGLRRTDAKTGRSSNQLDYAAFAAQINTIFRVRLFSGRVVALRLIKARLAPCRQVALGRRPTLDADNERFSLIFCGPQHSPLASAIHLFEHTRLGRFEMYFGEIGVREYAGIRYEAVFNQSAAKALSRTTLT
ncbi:MAG: hypothetical protein NT154_02010 [Verrucomicrobia bacterium]|nr:hypothetical protein [Verrucomicrobiota bacterium]